VNTAVHGQQCSPYARTTLDVLDLADSGESALDRRRMDVDALLGCQSREHGDLEVAIEDRHLATLLEVLPSNEFMKPGAASATAWNLLLAHPSAAIVDLRLVFDEHGNGALRPCTHGLRGLGSLRWCRSSIIVAA
jgi:lincosamide nucleotidyltransferase A/C/D/E